jgi:hypothetical protein
VVRRAHEDVVHVEEQPAAAPARELREELLLRDRRGPPGHVARDVLEDEGSPEPVLHAPDALDHVRERLFGVRQRQEVVRRPSLDARPAEVVGDPGRFHLRRERDESLEVGLVRGSVFPMPSETPWSVTGYRSRTARRTFLARPPTAM